MTFYYVMETITNIDINKEVQPKKRGRPRKNLLDKINKQNDKKKNPIDLSKQRELILHLPLIALNSKKQEIDINTNITDTETLLIVSEKYNSNGNESSDSSQDHDEEIKIRDKLIKKLKEELSAYKSMISDYGMSAAKDIKTYPVNLNLIDTMNGKTIIVEKTNIPCFWCTCEFNTLPCFIPERYDRGIFYVVGCFCSFNCAAAHNMDLRDYKVRDRYSLLKKLYSIIFGVEDEIGIAADKEVLQKYGGKLTIEEYRKNSKMCSKEYKLLMPPFIPIIAHIEERTKDKIIVHNKAMNNENSDTKDILNFIGN
jgi:hypothetical protein